MKVSEAVNLLQALRSIQGEKAPRGFAFAVARNIQVLTPVAEAYDTQRIEIIRQHADKDENGQPVVSENGMVTITDAAAQVSVSEEIASLLNRDDETVVVHKVLEAEFPDTLTSDTVLSLLPMLKD